MSEKTNWWKDLRMNHPVLYAKVGFECGPGWAPILDDLASWIEFQVKHNKMYMPEIRQIKEKFGELQFYYHYLNHNDEYNMGKLQGYVEYAERRSARTCEECGAPGKVAVKDGWYRCRCEDCE